MVRIRNLTQNDLNTLHKLPGANTSHTVHVWGGKCENVESTVQTEAHVARPRLHDGEKKKTLRRDLTRWNFQDLVEGTKGLTWGTNEKKLILKSQPGGENKITWSNIGNIKPNLNKNQDVILT